MERRGKERDRDREKKKRETERDRQTETDRETEKKTESIEFSDHIPQSQIYMCLYVHVRFATKMAI